MRSKQEVAQMLERIPAAVSAVEAEFRRLHASPWSDADHERCTALDNELNRLYGAADALRWVLDDTLSAYHVLRDRAETEG